MAELASGAMAPTSEGQKRGLTRAQLARLRKAIQPAHVDKKKGRGNLTYMAQHQVRAELTRIFGYGNWDSQVERMELLWEKEVLQGDHEYPDNPKPGNPPYYRACYMAQVRLTIRDYWGNVVCSFVECHAEANSVLPDRGEAHAMAITSVESYALRRAAIGLGDRFGLGLYDDGKQDALVIDTLQRVDPESPTYDPKKPDAGSSEGGAQPAPTGPNPRLQQAMNQGAPDNGAR